ncbi:MAG: helix-turn-helix domain-containing protein [Clostridia bacterium]|nr:helix-turn-helix domain-containing protein [Clostridia bacterium]
MEEFLLRKLTVITNEELERYDKLAMGDIGGNSITINDARLTKGKHEIIVLPHTRVSPTPLHKHTYVEIMIVLSGHINHVISGKSVSLEAGDILFLNRHITHSIEKIGSDDLAVNIIMTSSFVGALTGELFDTVFFDFLKENGKSDGAGVYLHFRAGGVKQIENLVENILFELTEYQTSTAILTRSAALLFHYLSLKSSGLLIDGNSHIDKIESRKMQILSYVKDNFRSATLGDLASKLYISPPYLSKMIKEYFGKSFKELLVEERMNRARKLFVDTDIPIGDIIRSLGYENESYFHREYKKRTGESPLGTRKNRQL